MDSSRRHERALPALLLIAGVCLGALPLSATVASASGTFVYGVVGPAGTLTAQHDTNVTLDFSVYLTADHTGAPGVNVTGKFLDVPGAVEVRLVSGDFGAVEFALVAPNGSGRTYNFSVVALDSGGQPASDPAVAHIFIKNYIGTPSPCPPTCLTPPSPGGLSEGMQVALAVGLWGGLIGGTTAFLIARAAKKRGSARPPPRPPVG